MSQDHEETHHPTGESTLLLEPNPGPMPASIVVWQQPDPPWASTQALADQQLEAMQAIEGYVLREQGPAALQAGPSVLAHEALYAWPASGQPLFQRRLFCVHEGVAYILVLTFADQSGAGRHPEGERVLHAFVPGQDLRWT